MAPLTPLEKKKSHNILLIGIAIVTIIVVIGAVAGYLYMDDQNKQNQKREELKQAFGDQRNETERQYQLIGAYPAVANKNYLDDYRKWIDGYLGLADNYSLAVATLTADGTAYRAMLANDSSDNANVIGACNEASARVKSTNNTAAGYEKDYQARLGLKTDASVAFDLALNRSITLYDTAWNYMQQDAEHLLYGGYLAYLRRCDQNNSAYNDSISLVQSAGVTYQTYLKGDEFYAVNTTIIKLQDNATKLGLRYQELQKKKPDVTLQNEQIVSAWSADKGFYRVASFTVFNNNRFKNVLPMKIHNVVVRYKLIDTATGNVRSTNDVSVTDFDSANFNSYISNVFTAILPCDQTGDYVTSYTIEFEY